jgi:DNA invertase Pin-like site-specific DNA recombinase
MKIIVCAISIGAELENSQHKIRQAEGIAIAKLQQKYVGRKVGNRGNREKMLKKYSKVVELLKGGTFSIRKIARHTNRSKSTTSVNISR